MGSLSLHARNDFHTFNVGGHYPERVNEGMSHVKCCSKNRNFLLWQWYIKGEDAINSLW